MNLHGPEGLRETVFAAPGRTGLPAPASFGPAWLAQTGR